MGHVPIELSNILDYFLMASHENKLIVTATGRRKCEIGLIVPGTYHAMAKDFRQAKLLNDELEKIPSRYTHFDFNFEKKSLQRQPHFMT